MYKMKLLAITAMAIFMAGVLTSATAQIKPLPGPGPLSGTYTMVMNANQLASGDTEYAMAETYGWTCYGETSGDLTGFVFVSMNYSLPDLMAAPSDGRIDISPPLPIGQTSKVTGGSWSKLIFVKGEYVGSVYGTIVGGTLTWSEKNLSATMSLVLSADNGTGAFVGNAGKGTFEGMFDPSLESKGGNVNGVLTLDY